MRVAIAVAFWLGTPLAAEVLDDAECVTLMEEFISAEPALWNEDIGE